MDWGLRGGDWRRGMRLLFDNVGWGGVRVYGIYIFSFRRRKMESMVIEDSRLTRE